MASSRKTSRIASRGETSKRYSAENRVHKGGAVYPAAICGQRDRVKFEGSLPKAWFDQRGNGVFEAPKGTIVTSGDRHDAPKLSEFLAHLEHVSVLHLAIFDRIHQGADEKNASPAFVQIDENGCRHGLQIEPLSVIEHLDA